MGKKARLPRKLKKDIKAWFQDGVVPSKRLRRWAKKRSVDMKKRGGPDHDEWLRVQRVMRRIVPLNDALSYVVRTT